VFYLAVKPIFRLNPVNSTPKTTKPQMQNHKTTNAKPQNHKYETTKPPNTKYETTNKTKPQTAKPKHSNFVKPRVIP
jgi:hypothetical protein